MRLPRFDYYTPQSLPEALTWLGEHQDQSVRVLGGGTDLLVDIRTKVIPDGHRPRCQVHRHGPWSARLTSPESIDILLALSRIPELRGISQEGSQIRIGAMTTIAELERSAIIREKLSGLHDGACQLGSPLVRNRATYGGNICNARPAGDTTIPTLALKGKLVLVSHRGERMIDHDDFITAPGRTILEPDEILKEIIFELPDKCAGTDSSSPECFLGSAYIKLTNRKALEIAVVGAAAAVTFDADSFPGSREGIKVGVVTSARITLGAVAPKPLLVPEAGDILIGKELTSETISEASRIASQKARPITDHRGIKEYRGMMVEVLVRRVLEICRDRAACESVEGLGS